MTGKTDQGKPRYYIDTSAWLAAMLGEEPGNQVFDEVRGGELLSSVLLVVEVFELQDVTLAFAQNREMPVLTTPKSLNLIHLRTALMFHRERALTRFVSLDGPLNAVGKELGLPVERVPRLR